jgi:integration host factor subunit beta
MGRRGGCFRRLTTKATSCDPPAWVGQRIAEQNPRLFGKDVKKAVNTILDEIVATLVRHDRVELRGFGTFTVKTWSARPFGRNPKTGAAISIPKTRHPSFRTAKEMKARLNGPAGNTLRAAFHKMSD